MDSKLLRGLIRFAADCGRYLAFPRMAGRTASRGVYSSFAAARRDIGHRAAGFDHALVAENYVARLSGRRESSDYPALFHLSRCMPERPVVLDFGGNVGIHYVRSRELLRPLSPRWIVWDVPHIVRAGRSACAAFGDVSFIDDLVQLEANRVDVLLAIGSMQYVEAPDEPLPRLLARGIRPRVVLLDEVPAYDGPAYVTLQNGGLSWYPQRIFNRRELLAAMDAAHYTLTDAWEYQLDAVRPPFHRDRWVDPYSGFCFVDRSDAAD